jgi:hypothetical protein
LPQPASLSSWQTGLFHLSIPGLVRGGIGNSQMPMDMLGLVDKVFYHFGYFRYTTLPMFSSARHILKIQPLVRIRDMI